MINSDLETLFDCVKTRSYVLKDMARSGLGYGITNDDYADFNPTTHHMVEFSIGEKIYVSKKLKINIGPGLVVYIDGKRVEEDHSSSENNPT